MVKIYKIALFLFLFALAPLSVDAASLSFSKPAASYNVGSTFSLSIFVESPDQAMNAASAAISYPSDKLEVVSLSKSGSIITLWAEEPSFSNGNGTISFEGVVMNPGYTGTGRLLTVTFRAKAPGQANASFSSGSVLANDGQGTNILKGLHGATITIGNTESAPVPTSPVPTPTPPITTEAPSSGNAVAINSSTHPDQGKWYTNSTPEFTWKLPEGALEVRTLIGKSSNLIPTVRYAPAISSRKVDALSDGTYYFSLQVRTAEGWGDISRYRVNIDTTPPDPFSVTLSTEPRESDAQPVLSFNTTDDVSGIDHYEIKVGGENKVIRVTGAEASKPYTLPPQYPGRQTAIVTAVDRAGNTRSASVDFTIDALETPIITDYSREISAGDYFTLTGTTYPNSVVTVLFKQGGKIVSEEYTKSDSQGNFTLKTKGNRRLKQGAYTFTVRVTDKRGASSNETEPQNLMVNPGKVVEFMGMVLTYLSAIILIILALGGIIGLIIFLWYRGTSLVRRMRKETIEAEKMLEKSFAIFVTDIDDHIERLEAAKVNRKLTKEETAFLRDFKKNMKDAEGLVVKKLKDVINEH